MNTHESPLADALHERADSLPDTAPPSLEAVRSRARSIRNRRRAVVAGVAAAVFAVATPVALNLDSSNRTGVVPASSTDARAGGTGLPVAALAVGADPAVGWMTGDGSGPVLHRADGTTIELDPVPRSAQEPDRERGLDSFATFGVTTVVSYTDLVVWYGADGRVVGSWPAHAGLVVNEQRTHVGFVTSRGVPMVFRQDGRPVELERVKAVEGGPVALVGENCMSSAGPGSDEPSGCVMWLNTDRGGWIVTSDGMQSSAGPTGGDPDTQPLRLLADYAEPMPWNGDTMDNRLAGGRTAEQGRWCSAIWTTLPYSETHWANETCKHQYGQISTRYSRILGWEATTATTRRVGESTLPLVHHDEIAMYGLAGEGLLWSRAATDGPEQGVLYDGVWENDETVLASAWADGLWRLVRFGPDGAMEQVGQPVEGHEYSPTVLAETQP